MVKTIVPQTLQNEAKITEATTMITALSASKFGDGAYPNNCTACSDKCKHLFSFSMQDMKMLGVVFLLQVRYLYVTP
jgi:hypothetical protein